ncbi:MAG TPA: PAS domain-containing protein [Prosthecobacter sp.]
MVLFASHDLLKDAPFSRMDLISCRNLLIYLNRGAQKRVFDTFHFASKPGALLFLGTSESVEEDSALFRAVDKKNRLYAHQPAARVGVPVPTGPSSLMRAVELQERARTGPVVHGRRFAQGGMPGLAPEVPVLDRAALAEFHFKLVERLAPPSVIVSADHEIVHLSENAGRFFKFVGGEPSNNLLRIVDPMIRVELRAGLFRAAETNTTVTLANLPVEVEGHTRLLNIRISPASEISPGFLLVIFEARSTDKSAQASSKEEQGTPPEPLIRQLERELEQVKNQLHDTVEQYEASTEEMKASNEELQAMNEELRSATEELETSREELQSINEELATVNAEMKSKVDELANANSDLQNLMASTAIAIVFLDRNLSITRYTPNAVELFHLIPTDVGRPLENLKNRLDYPELISDAEKVLRTLVPVDREVQDGSRWFLARLQPYRTVEDHIAGVVLTFVDISERRAAAEALREQIDEVTRFNQVAVGREMRMIELKKEINELLSRLGEAPRYMPDAGLEEEETEAPPAT